MFARKIWLAVALALVATPALAQTAENPRAAAEADRASHDAPGDSERASGPGTEVTG